uniref:Cyclin n=1 Tax=Chenopodium quinoa TaxID=63459 RepID=A0A803NF34_CHEQI
MLDEKTVYRTGFHVVPPARDKRSRGDDTKGVAHLSRDLERLVARNDPLVEHSGRNSLIHHVSLRPLEAGELGMSLKVFNGVRAPNISIAKYLERLYKYTNCSPSCFVVGYVYIDRLVHKHPELLVISLNVHRLLLTSVMIASKMLDDVYALSLDPSSSIEFVLQFS